MLAELGRGAGLIPVIFRKAQNRIQYPAKLRRLINLIDDETWTGLGIDVKGEIYEGLLEKNAQDIKLRLLREKLYCPVNDELPAEKY